NRPRHCSNASSRLRGILLVQQSVHANPCPHLRAVLSQRTAACHIAGGRCIRAMTRSITPMLSRKNLRRGAFLALVAGAAAAATPYFISEIQEARMERAMTKGGY